MADSSLDVITPGEVDQDEELDLAVLRRWLSLLNQPDRLDDPDLIKLVRQHGRVPTEETPLAMGHAAASLLRDTIEGLEVEDSANRYQELPYKVLKLCFIEGAKLFQAANRLGLSERQLSRERTRALSLLRSELLKTSRVSSFRPEPIPAIVGYMPRAGQTRALLELLESSRLVNVSGPPGIGKTSLVADMARETGEQSGVFWYKFRPGVNTKVGALLYDLGGYLFDEGSPHLASYLDEALPQPDVSIATRLCLRGFDNGRHLLVLDDYHVVEDAAVAGLLDELVTRLPALRIIVVGRHRSLPLGSGELFEVPPFSRKESEELLARLRVKCEPELARALHKWTGGIPHLLRLAASWIKTADAEEIERGLKSFEDQADVQVFLLSTVTELLDSDDRALLEAASIFRARFSDDALASVADQSRGAVADASLRLERSYVATRSAGGDSSFFHGSVKTYVYDRLSPSRRAELHERAARWYRHQGLAPEAEYHEKRARPEGLDQGVT